jgi:hypothetical protein
MKNLRLLLILLLAFTLFSIVDSKAQGKSKTKHKSEKKAGGPPPWAPAHGYRAKTRYVYFKDYPVYYDNDRGVYISMSGKNWSISAKLPDILKGVDLLAAPKIDLDFSGDEPQQSYDKHREEYPGKKKD